MEVFQDGAGGGVKYILVLCHQSVELFHIYQVSTGLQVI